MGSGAGASGLPGMGTKVSPGTSREFLKEGQHFRTIGIRIDKDTEDADNSPVTKLRPGLVLVRVEDGVNAGKFVHVDHTDAPAAEDIKEACILYGDHDMLNPAGAVEDQQGAGVLHGIVEDAQILWGTDDALTIEAIKDILKLVHFYTEVG